MLKETGLSFTGNDINETLDKLEKLKRFYKYKTDIIRINIISELITHLKKHIIHLKCLKTIQDFF